MAAPPAKGVPDEEVKEVEDDYESDEFDVEDDEGDEYQDGEEEEEEDEEAPQENGKSLTALLLADNNGNGDLDEDEDEDDGYTPDGQPDPAEQPIDGNARELTPETENLAPVEAKISAPPVAAPGLKRKTSGDEEDDEDEVEEETEAKKIKT